MGAHSQYKGGVGVGGYADVGVPEGVKGTPTGESKRALYMPHLEEGAFYRGDGLIALAGQLGP